MEILLLLLATSFLSSSTSSSPAVHDSHGEPITGDSLYTIHRSGIGFLGGLTIDSLNSTCPCAAFFSHREVDRGLPLRFLPYHPGTALQTGHAYRFRVSFSSSPPCAGNGEWTINDDGYVVTGGGGSTNLSYFAVLPQEAGYALGYCGSCGTCRNRCLPVGTDGRLFLTTGGVDLKVYMLKEGV